MNPPNLYDAWLTAGNTLQPVGDWIGANWLGLAASATALAVAVWVLRRYIRGGTDYRTRNDRAMARRYTAFRPTPEVQQPGRDHQLYLDCIAVYGDCDELERLRNAIHQHRKENPQP